MKPAAFDYLRPETLDQAAFAIAEAGDEGRILAGGQSLVAMLNMRLARPSVLVDLMHAPEAKTINQTSDGLRIGAAVRQADLEKWAGLASTAPLLAKTLPWIGHSQTRARGTVVGSIAHADPSAELPLTLAALNGQVHLRRGKSCRVLPARDFFLGMMLTDKGPDEIIEAVTFPTLPALSGTAFREVGRRKGDFAIVAVSAIVTGQHVRLAIGGVNDTPLVQDWEGLDAADEAEALNALAWSLDARDDLHATARYRRDLVRRLGLDALKEARACAV